MTARPVLALSLAALLAAASVARAQEVEDFEGYVDTPDLTAVWQFATELDTTTNHTPGGTKSLRLEDVVGPFTGLFSTNTFEEPVDLTEIQVSIWVRRDPASFSPTNVLVAFEDGSAGGCSTGTVPITGSAWQRLILDMGDCGFLDTSAVTAMSLNAGNPGDSSGTLAVNFDDLGVFLFVGDFEAGDTARWSVTMPTP